MGGRFIVDVAVKSYCLQKDNCMFFGDSGMEENLKIGYGILWWTFAEKTWRTWKDARLICVWMSREVHSCPVASQKKYDRIAVFCAGRIILAVIPNSHATKIFSKDRFKPCPIISHPPFAMSPSLPCKKSPKYYQRLGRNWLFFDAIRGGRLAGMNKQSLSPLCMHPRCTGGISVNTETIFAAVPGSAESQAEEAYLVADWQSLDALPNAS